MRKQLEALSDEEYFKLEQQRREELEREPNKEGDDDE